MLGLGRQSSVGFHSFLAYELALMPYKCVAGGCSRTNGDNVSLHHFPKGDSLRKQWSAAVGRYRQDWEGPTDMSMLCSMHFEATCYDDETFLRESMGLPSKRRRLIVTVPNSSTCLP